MLLFHEDPAVKAAAAGVLMNVCATSSRCRSELAYSGLLRQLLDQIVASTATDAIMGEAEVRKNALGALNNLMLDAQAAAVATLAYLTLNEDDARVLVRLQGGLKKLQALLYANDPILQASGA